MNFELGQVVITRGLDAAINGNPDAQREVVEAFNRYRGGDWGDTCESDQELNNNAVKNNDDRIKATSSILQSIKKKKMYTYESLFYNKWKWKRC